MFNMSPKILTALLTRLQNSLLEAFIKKIEEAFATVTIEKGVTPIKQKMDEASVEAMLCEAILCEASIKC